MKSKIIIITLMIAMSLGFTACGSKAQNNDSQANTQSPGNNGQGQFKRADLSGEVTSVSGSDISLKLIEIPAVRQGNVQGAQNKNGQAQSQSNNQNNNQNNSQNTKRGMRQGQGQGPGRELKYTGETKTISIPAGTSITTFERGQNGRQTKNVELKDIKQGDILQIWYADKEKGTIERMGVMTRGSGNQDSKGNTDKNQAQ